MTIRTVSDRDTTADALWAIALRDGISVDEVLTLCQRWVYPLSWRVADAIALAAANDDAWQAWRAHHHELLQLGYVWPLVKG